MGRTFNLGHECSLSSDTKFMEIPLTADTFTQLITVLNSSIPAKNWHQYACLFLSGSRYIFTGVYCDLTPQEFLPYSFNIRVAGACMAGDGDMSGGLQVSAHGLGCVEKIKLLVDQVSRKQHPGLVYL